MTASKDQYSLALTGLKGLQNDALSLLPHLTELPLSLDQKDLKWNLNCNEVQVKVQDLQLLAFISCLLCV